MASFSALAAARHALLARKGWNVEADGMFGAPPIRVVVGDEVHVTVLKALSLLGFGRNTVVRVPVDGQGRLKPDALPELNEQTIVCIQAGNVNTGAFDPALEICRKASAAGAWVHVDGAFGLWAACSVARNHLTAGLSKANSWATDAHKWLNVPYDCGIAFVRDARYLRNAMAASASYLSETDQREPSHYSPELSRRARAIDVWAAIKCLGREGVEALIEKTCKYAGDLAKRLEAAGFRILNDVVINQVLVSAGTDAATDKLIEAIQLDGTCWCGGTTWQGQRAMRVGVSNWSTSDEDMERTFRTIVTLGKSVGAI